MKQNHSPEKPDPQTEDVTPQVQKLREILMRPARGDRR